MRQSSIQVVVWVALPAFSQIYSEDWEQMKVEKVLKSLRSGKKRNTLKVDSKEGMVIKEIHIIKNKLNTWH